MRRRTADFLQGNFPRALGNLQGEDRANIQVSSQPGETRKRGKGKENGQRSNFQSPGLKINLVHGFGFSPSCFLFLLPFPFPVAPEKVEWRDGKTLCRVSPCRWLLTFLFSHIRRCIGHDDDTLKTTDLWESGQREDKGRQGRNITKTNEINYIQLFSWSQHAPGLLLFTLFIRILTIVMVKLIIWAYSCHHPLTNNKYSHISSASEVELIHDLA